MSTAEDLAGDDDARAPAQTDAPEVRPVRSNEQAAPATPPGPGGPPCLGAAAMVALSVWIRRKR